MTTLREVDEIHAELLAEDPAMADAYLNEALQGLGEEDGPELLLLALKTLDRAKVLHQTATRIKAPTQLLAVALETGELPAGFHSSVEQHVWETRRV